MACDVIVRNVRMTYLIDVNCLSRDTNFDEESRIDFEFIKITTSRGHRLIANHCLKGVAIAHSHCHWPQILIDEFFLFEVVSVFIGRCLTFVGRIIL